MKGLRRGRERAGRLAIEAYGVRLAVEVEDPSVLDEVRAILPPGWQECATRRPQAELKLTNFEDDRCDVFVGDSAVARAVDRAVAVGMLDARIRAEISRLAPDRVFIHSGVVALGERALVLPGHSFSGKTTLVHALIKAGAAYLSDEYAVLDDDGLVHPYPKPLSIRNGIERRHTTEAGASSLGATTFEGPARVALVALTSYNSEAGWQPERSVGSEVALALLSHAVLAREQPQRVMAVVAKAAAGATLLEGDRGEAEPTAEALLQALVP